MSMFTECDCCGRIEACEPVTGTRFWSCDRCMHLFEDDDDDGQYEEEMYQNEYLRGE